MRHVVILAGGTGTRLWPASRQTLPKQFLSLARDNRPLITAVAELAKKLVGDRVTIVTTETLAAATRAVVPNVALITEPIGRNTAPAVALAGALIAAYDPEATIAFLPADHHVRDPTGLITALDACLTAAEMTDAVALIGIPPTRPETGFGYLEMGEGPSAGIRPVLRFVEKPTSARAREYLASGQYLWNAGIFCLTARRLGAEIRQHLPGVASTVRSVTEGGRTLHDPHGLYARLPAMSFDHGVMEHIDHVVAMPADVGWSDVGAWSALPEVRGTDADGNTIAGEAVVIDGTGNILVTDDTTLITTIGVSDLIVVRSGTALLIVHKNQAQRVRELVELLRARGLAQHL